MLRTVLILCALIVFAFQSFALIPTGMNLLEIIPDEKEDYYSNGYEYISKTTGKPLVIYGQMTSVHYDTPRKMVEEYLNQNAKLLGVKKDLSNVQFLSERIMPGGPRVRFSYLYDDIPIYGSSLTISLNNNHQVVFVINRYKEIPSSFIPKFDVSEFSALHQVKTYLGISEECCLESAEKYIYSNKGTVRTAIKVELVGNEFIEHWEVLIDAVTGEIFRVEDKACSSQGYVFNPDPVTRHRTLYGQPGFIDNNNADNDSLAASLVEVDLGELVNESGLNRLENNYASIADFSNPNTGLYEQESDTFLYSRSHDSFEAVNVFYHLTQSMRYLNDTLALNVWPLQYTGGVKFDPDGINGGQNAVYSWGRVAFGKPQGYVNAGESHAIIHHELGHGIHDWITDMNLSQVDGLSEGIADYWAQSYTRSLGYYSPGDDQYDWFVVWGLHPWGQVPFLRITNYPGHYPEDLGFGSHIDGQMWSSSLMSIYDNIGKQSTDRLLLEAISMTDSYTDQRTAARALVQADILLFNGIHLDILLDTFLARGYFQSLIEPAFVSNTRSGLPPLRVRFHDLTTAPQGSIIGWEWDLDGDGTIDSDQQSPEWTYDEPGSYDVTLRVYTADRPYSITVEDNIVVTSEVLVWDFKPGDNSSSGLFFEEYLSDNVQPEVVYTTRFPENLFGVNTLFLSLGNVGDNFDAEDFALHNIFEPLTLFITSGGNVLLEGGTPFESFLLTGDLNNYRQMSDYFNFNNTSYSPVQNQVNSLNGQEQSLAEGMSFADSDQEENWMIQSYTPGPGAVSVFSEDDLGVVGFSNDGDYGGKTICFSYAISKLSPNGELSTREELMRRICEFFGFQFSNGTENESEIISSTFSLRSNYPNPFNTTTKIEYDLASRSQIYISVYDILGREIAILENGIKQAGHYTTQWSTQSRNSSGIYFLVMKAKDKHGIAHTFSKKMVYMK